MSYLTETYLFLHCLLTSNSSEEIEAEKIPKAEQLPQKASVSEDKCLGQILGPIRSAVQCVLLVQSHECQLVVICSGASFQQAAITGLGECPPLASWQLSVPEKKSRWAVNLLWKENYSRSIADWLMLSKHDLWLCETVVLVLIGAIFSVQSLIFHVTFGFKVVPIHMYSDADNVNSRISCLTLS